jgi:hypoxanthine phosphoribosyltransferase
MTDPGVAGVTFLTAEELSAVAARLGDEISKDHPAGVVLVGMLKGSVCFMADVARFVTVPCSIDFLQLSAYTEGGPRVRLSKDVDVDLTGQDAVIVVDVIDSGLTVNYVRRLFVERGAKSTKVCALLDRRRRRVVPIDVAYLGVEVGEEHLVGYGLDFEERYRNLPYLVTADPAALQELADRGGIAGASGDFPL